MGERYRLNQNGSGSCSEQVQELLYDSVIYFIFFDAFFTKVILIYSVFLYFATNLTTVDAPGIRREYENSLNLRARLVRLFRRSDPSNFVYFLFASLPVAAAALQILECLLKLWLAVREELLAILAHDSIGQRLDLQRLLQEVR